ncbi:hypothetical protein [Herbaspirillum frisingense]|uniref:hypothetical protein n=1 Tax=Herbaspirillum frisingense TaxID=92645 RepID=UPI0039B012D4
MPINGFNVGRDISLDIISPNGPLDFGLVTNFHPKQEVVEKMIKGIDGISRPVRFYNGWTGTLDIERRGDAVDAYFALSEQSYYDGVDEGSCTITETIQEPDGSVSQYRYLGVVLKYDDAGPRTGDNTIQQKLSFMASRRVRV